MRRTLKSVRIPVLVLAVAAALVLASACQKASEKSAEKMIENALEKAGGGKADVDLSGGKLTVKTDQGTANFSAEGGTWPADLPGDVPKVDGGKVKGVFSAAQGEGKNWTIAVDEVDEAAYAKYIETLKTAGYEIGMNMTTADGAMTQAKKGTTQIIVTFSKTAKSLGLNVTTNVAG
jgi:uncharacterized protein (DUF2147 family)